MESKREKKQRQGPRTHVCMEDSNHIMIGWIYECLDCPQKFVGTQHSEKQGTTK